MKVSIIIAVKDYNDFLKESIQKCLELDYPDYEIIVLPDTAFDHSNQRIRIIPTGHCLPAQKRDIGAGEAKGEILAFLDDDAFPIENWLRTSIKNFNDEQVAAVGGPAVTPAGDNILKQASGLVYESFIVSGNFCYRYKRQERRYVDDYPSCNLLVRKEIFQKIGGFKTNFWPGEDTILCLEITKKLKKLIVYDPDAVVFHHRRPLFDPHLKQIKNYAMHRGYFVKRFPQTSLKWQYFVPTLFLLALAVGFVASLVYLPFLIVYIFSLMVYAAVVYINAYQSKNSQLTFFVFCGIILTHLYYGLFFVEGLLKFKLKEEA